MRRLMILVCALGLAGTALAQNPLRVEAVPAYEGQTRQGDMLALRVNVSNSGPDTEGVIRVDSQSESANKLYPISLPRGASKELIVTLRSSYTAMWRVTLETNRGSAFANPQVSIASATSSVLAIGDDSGGLASLAQSKTKDQYGGSNQICTVAYTKAESAPDNEADYGSMSVVILAAGSERMGERQIEALRLYILRGGHAVVMGGASAPLLTDPRWREILPIASLTPREITVEGRTVTLQVATPKPGGEIAKSGPIPIVRRGLGLGRVSYFAANPFEGGLAQAEERDRIVLRTLALSMSANMVRQTLGRRAGMFPTFGAEIPANESSNYNNGVYSSSVSSSYYASSHYPSNTSSGGTNPNDPFALSIPPTSSILTVLGIYFIVVLPINFLLLRALKRLEWAWFTAPVVAFVFAGLLFRNAGGLYRAKLGTATETLIAGTSGSRDALAMGRSQIFFPSSGAQSIPIPGATAITGSANQDDMYMSGGPSPIDVVMQGEPSLPRYSSSALEFRDLYFQQAVDLGGAIEVRRIAEGVYEVVNGSRYSLSNARVTSITGRVVTMWKGTRETIKPGETMRFLSGNSVGDSSAPNASPVPVSLLRGIPLLLARLEGFRPGPLIGTPVAPRTGTVIAISGER